MCQEEMIIGLLIAVIVFDAFLIGFMSYLVLAEYKQHQMLSNQKGDWLVPKLYKT
jgi:hypothetical protein